MPLQQIAAMAEQLGQLSLAAEARALEQRAADGRFYVACVGQFKRGKSTLIDALIGTPLLPMGVLPVTSVPTVVRLGVAPAARVQFGGGHWQDVRIEDLAQFVSEEFNPENAKHVSGVEVFAPAAVLKDGLCLVDTPGVGSVFAANSAATRAFLPHVDAAVVVIGAEPPVTGEELELAAAVADQVRDVIVVLSKADRSSRGDVVAARQFSERVLTARLGRTVGPLLEISARERLEGGGPSRDWPRLVERLETLARDSGRALASRAAERGQASLAARLAALIDQEREALSRPLTDYEARMAALEANLGAADRALGDLGYQLMGEERRLADAFAAERNAFAAAERDAAHDELARAAAQAGGRGRALRRVAAGAAQDIAARRITPWLAREQTHAETAYAAAMERFVALAGDFLSRTSRDTADDPGLAIDADALSRFSVKSEFRFHFLERVAADASPFRFLADLARGVVGARSAIVADAHRLLDELIEINSARIEGDLNERVRESRRLMEREVRSVIAAARDAARVSLERVRRAHAEGVAGIELELRKLDELRAELPRLSPSAPTPAP